jgi:hypothetical protein
MIMGVYILDTREDDHGNIVLYKTCDVTNKEYSVTISKQEYEKLQSPTCPLIQDVLPHLSNAQREFVLSTSTPAEWKQMWSEE